MVKVVSGVGAWGQTLKGLDPNLHLALTPNLGQIRLRLIGQRHYLTKDSFLPFP